MHNICQTYPYDLYAPLSRIFSHFDDTPFGDIACIAQLSPCWWSKHTSQFIQFHSTTRGKKKSFPSVKFPLLILNKILWLIFSSKERSVIYANVVELNAGKFGLSKVVALMKCWGGSCGVAHIFGNGSCVIHLHLIQAYQGPRLMRSRIYASREDKKEAERSVERNRHDPGSFSIS